MHPSLPHRITEWSGLAGTSVGHPAQPPAQAGSPTAGCTAPRPGGAGISPEKETPPPPWAAWARAPSPGGDGGHEDLHPQFKRALPGLSLYSCSYTSQKGDEWVFEHSAYTGFPCGHPSGSATRPAAGRAAHKHGPALPMPQAEGSGHGPHGPGEAGSPSPQQESLPVPESWEQSPAAETPPGSGAACCR